MAGKVKIRSERDDLNVGNHDGRIQRRMFGNSPLCSTAYGTSAVFYSFSFSSFITFTFLQVLYEDKDFPHKKRAALLTSKVYHHLGEFEDSLQFALGAGELFDIQGIWL